jgi:uncharacterized membrane protein
MHNVIHSHPRLHQSKLVAFILLFYIIIIILIESFSQHFLPLKYKITVHLILIKIMYETSKAPSYLTTGPSVHSKEFYQRGKYHSHYKVSGYR